MISGMYMGEIARLILEKLRKNGLLFQGQGSEEMATRGRFYTKYVSEIERYLVLIFWHVLTYVFSLNINF